MTTRYEIRLAARSTARCVDWFPDVDLRTDGTLVLLRAELDQAGLHGILERVRILPFDLVDVRRTRSRPRRAL